MKAQVFDRRGGLGADLERETTKQATEMANKKKQYAEQIRMAARTSQPISTRATKPTVEELEIEKRKLEREKALAYAKNVPKPKVIVKAQEAALPPAMPSKDAKISEREELLMMIEQHDRLYNEIRHYGVEDAE